MNLAKKYPILFSLFAITSFNCYSQLSYKMKSPQDTIIPKMAIFQFNQNIYYLKEKVKLQQYEIRVLKELGKIDSLQYGKDSLITVYTSKTGIPLLRITQKKLTFQNNYEDSIVVYYNKNGLIEYSEMWQAGTKLTCRRFQYDDQNRLIREVSGYPTPRVAEWIYTYDSTGNYTREGQVLLNFDFWDFEKSKRNIPE